MQIASRHPGQADGDNVKRIRADAHGHRSVEGAVAGADGVVNAIGLYVEHGRDTFHSVHVDAAARIARVAHRRSRLLSVAEKGKKVALLGATSSTNGSHPAQATRFCASSSATVVGLVGS